MTPEFLLWIMIIVLIILLFKHPELLVPAPTKGIVKGIIRAPDSAIVTEATITLLSPGGEILQTVLSGADGSYEMPLMDFGTYTAKAHKTNPDGSQLEGQAKVILDSESKVVDITLVNA